MPAIVDYQPTLFDIDNDSFSKRLRQGFMVIPAGQFEGAGHAILANHGQPERLF